MCVCYLPCTVARMADNCVLWVGGLNDKVTEELLYELFLQSGPLEKVTIPKDKDGRKKKFAFVNFKHEESVPFAMQLFEGIRMFGQYLRLQTRQGSSSVGSTPPHNSISPYTSPQHQTQESREMYPQNNRSSYHRSSSGSNLDSFQQESFRSPRDREQGSRSNDPPPRYQRSNTWHNGERSQDGWNDRHQKQSPQYRSDSTSNSRQSPQYGYDPASTSRQSPQYGHDSRSNSPHNYPNVSPQHPNEPSDSVEVRRQRVLQQQNMSLTIHRQGQDQRSRRDYDRMQPYQRPHSTRRRY